MLLRDWQGYTRLDVNADVAVLAGALAARYPLKGADAVHLASAYLLSELYGRVRFLSFDKQLNVAAEQLLTLACGVNIIGRLGSSGAGRSGPHPFGLQ
jgi:predicted nucleic acid-binding protein